MRERDRTLRFLLLATLTFCLLLPLPASAQSWTQMPPQTTRNFYDCWFDPAAPSRGSVTGWYLVAGDQYSFVYGTSDGGGTLVPQDVFMYGLFLAAQSITYTSSTTGYVAGTGVLKTLDGGLHWSGSLDFGMVQGKLTDVLFASPDSGYTAGEGWYGPTATFFKTTNAGVTWTQHDPPLGSSTQVTCLARPSSHTLYMGCINSGGRTLYKSTNDGDSWTALNVYLSIRSLEFVSATVGYAGTDLGISRTTDGGASWTPVLTAGTAINAIRLLGRTGFAVGANGGIFHSTDTGLTWTPMASPVQGTAILYSLCVLSTDFAYAVGSGGTILRYGVPAGIDPLPLETSVQLYPNPADAQTRMVYTLPEAATVNLRLYDPSGRLLRTVVGGTQAAGVHGVTLDLQDLSPGIYFSRLEAAGASATRKIVIAR